MSEKDDAVKLANRVLDKPYIDPDGDICLLARQFLRAIEPDASVPRVGMQQLINAGFNAFGLQLFAESFADKVHPEEHWAGLPFSFSFRGLRFIVTREPGEEIDTRHH